MSGIEERRQIITGLERTVRAALVQLQEARLACDEACPIWEAYACTAHHQLYKAATELRALIVQAGTKAEEKTDG